MPKPLTTWAALLLASAAGTAASEFVSWRLERQSSAEVRPTEIVTPNQVDTPATVALSAAAALHTEAVHN